LFIVKSIKLLPSNQNFFVAINKNTTSSSFSSSSSSLY